MRMKKGRSSLLGILTPLLLWLSLEAGCGGGQSDAPPSVDVTGTWNGTASADNGNKAVVVINAIQTAASVTGTGTFDGLPVNVTGKVSDNKWAGELSADFGTVTYHLTVSGDTASGSGSSGTDSGSVTLTRAAN
jgi:hypothetical protein